MPAGRRVLCQPADMSDDAPPIPAATVVLVRDGADDLEVLMLHRTSKVAFGGMWVFPGGRIEDGDRFPDDVDEVASARRAAVREAAEECGLRVDPADTVLLAHWMPPQGIPRRYSTWFFLARASEGEVLVDGGEIHDHAWLAPREVLARRDRGEVDLAPPTWVTLHDLADLPDVETALKAVQAVELPPRYETRWGTAEEGTCAMWAGDAGYETADANLPGPRHRLWMLDSGWRLERRP